MTRGITEGLAVEAAVERNLTEVNQEEIMLKNFDKSKKEKIRSDNCVVKNKRRE